MAHQRKLIRDAVVAALTDATAAGEQVEATRVIPYRKSTLPAIAVYTLKEATDRDSANTAPRRLRRELELEIAAVVAPSDRMDDALDALAVEIEAAMDADRELGGTCADSFLESTTIEPLADGDSIMGLMTMTYVVTYQTEAVADASAADDFLRVGATQNLGNAQPAGDRATDQFTVQESP